MNAIDFLARQHRSAEHLFDRLQRPELSPAARGDLFARLADALALHCALEEDLLYPRVEGLRALEAHDAGLAEHQALKEKLVDLLEMGSGDPAFEVKLRE